MNRFHFLEKHHGMLRKSAALLRGAAALCMTAVLFFGALPIFGDAGGAELWNSLYKDSPLDEGEAVLTINGHDVMPDEYLSYVMPYLVNADGNGSQDGEEAVNSIRQSAENDIRTNYQLMMWAEEEGYLTEDVTVDEYREALAAEEEAAGGKEALDAQKASNFMTDEVYELRLRQSIVQGKLRQFVYSEGSPYITPTDEELKEIYDAYQFYTTKQILIFSSDDPEQDMKKKETAVEALNALKDGKTFEEVMELYNEDPNAMGMDTVYIAKTGDLFSEYETAARALAVDEVSSIITSQVGYHIIKRVEPSAEDLRTQVSIYFENYKVNEKMNDLMYAEEIVYGKHYEEIDPGKIATE